MSGSKLKVERFKSFQDCLSWCVKNYPLINSDGIFIENSVDIKVFEISLNWEAWKKILK